MLHHSRPSTAQSQLTFPATSKHTVSLCLAGLPLDPTFEIPLALQGHLKHQFLPKALSRAVVSKSRQENDRTCGFKLLSLLTLMFYFMTWHSGNVGINQSKSPFPRLKKKRSRESRGPGQCHSPGSRVLLSQMLTCVMSFGSRNLNQPFPKSLNLPPTEPSTPISSRALMGTDSIPDIMVNTRKAVISQMGTV